jgi:phosphatidylserine/phosphatidylglycerophosphate/cardiolipin synthase-like enzyme
MHNKLFIADGSFAVTGGRNIADEYFDRGGSANFIDMDLLSSGPVVAELAAVFDAFWNSKVVYPIAAWRHRRPATPSPARSKPLRPRRPRRWAPSRSRPSWPPAGSSSSGPRRGHRRRAAEGARRARRRRSPKRTPPCSLRPAPRC